METLNSMDDVPEWLSRKFIETYGQNGKRTVQEAVKKLIEDVNQQNETI